MTFSGARAHPDYLAYFNEFAGDTPEAYIIDSDLEWDQSWARVGQILRANGASEESDAENERARVLMRFPKLANCCFSSAES